MELLTVTNRAAKWLREKRGELSYRELGRLVGLTHTTIANAEDGNATEATWIKLAGYFEESPSKILAMADKTASLSSKDIEDEWVTRTALRISKLPAESRNLVDHLIKYLAEKEREDKK